MKTVNEIFEYLDKKAPVAYKMDFDNPGFLVGNGNWQVNKVLLALDITDEVINEALPRERNLLFRIIHFSFR